MMKVIDREFIPYYDKNNQTRMAAWKLTLECGHVKSIPACKAHGETAKHVMCFICQPRKKPKPPKAKDLAVYYEHLSDIVEADEKYFGEE